MLPLVNLIREGAPIAPCLLSSESLSFLMKQWLFLFATASGVNLPADLQLCTGTYLQGRPVHF